MLAHLNIDRRSRRGSLTESRSRHHPRRILQICCEGGRRGQRAYQLRANQWHGCTSRCAPFRPLRRLQAADGGSQSPAASARVGLDAHLDGKPWPATTAFGDLGIDLARARLVHSRLAQIATTLRRRFRPASAGHARPSMGCFGTAPKSRAATLYLPDPKILPLADLPILGTIASGIIGEDDAARTDRPGGSERARRLLFARMSEPERRARDKPKPKPSLGRSELGHSRARAHESPRRCRRPLSPRTGRALVLLVSENVGKVLWPLRHPLGDVERGSSSSSMKSRRAMPSSPASSRLGTKSIPCRSSA